MKFHMQSKVEKIVSSEENPSEAGGVIVNGQTIPADLVIMAVGVTPASDFLKNSGIELERDGGVKVDEFLRVEGVNNVYAIGEYILGRHYLGISRRLWHRGYCTFSGRDDWFTREDRTLECLLNLYMTFKSVGYNSTLLGRWKPRTSGRKNDCRHSTKV